MPFFRLVTTTGSASRLAFTLSLRLGVRLLPLFYAESAHLFIGLKVGRRTVMDVASIGIGTAFFAMAWGLVWALGHLQGEKQS